MIGGAATPWQLRTFWCPTGTMSYEPIDPTEPTSGCPLTAAVAALGGKWNLICLYWIAAGPRRFGELRRLMPGISHKVLTDTLRILEREGLVTRTIVSETPAHVDYALSPYGESVKPLLDAVRIWGRRHLDAAPAGRKDG